jgi:hypothetical protein
MRTSVPNSPSRQRVPSWHAGFLRLLPQVLYQARWALRKLPPEAQEDAIQEVLVRVMVTYRRLVQAEKVAQAYPSVLTRYALLQLRQGRQVGQRLNVRDVLSRYAQLRKGFVVERLDHYDQEHDAWKEAVVEDHRTPPPEQAAFRVDFPGWLGQFDSRDRGIIEALALGHRTKDVAQQFRLSPGRVSQKRLDYAHSWREFHGEWPACGPSPASATKERKEACVRCG